MSAHHMYKVLEHYGQLFFAWLESSYGCGTMGLFVLSYGCPREAWHSQIATLKALNTWLKTMLPIVQIEAPYMWGPMGVCHDINKVVLDLLEKMEPSFNTYTPSEGKEYPELPADPAQWFL